MSNRLDEKVDALQVLRRAELLARWKRAYRRPAPQRISRELLLLALAYRMQERAEGGLSKAALKRLNGRGSVDGEETPPPRPKAPRLRPGTRLVREWHGEVHQVMVRDKGFEYRSQQYRSLSQIARAITAAAKEVGFTVPLVVRLEGTNVAEARRVLDESRAEIPVMVVATDLADAAKKVCAAASVTA